MASQSIKVILYGETIDLHVTDDETVLQALIDAGQDPPFNCQIGACGICRALLKSGKVEMEDSDILTSAEIKRGIILTCQAHPVAPNVVIDYDAID